MFSKSLVLNLLQPHLPCSNWRLCLYRCLH
uniref:Uncharacterized protein n=1 Tax=Rhizophora mucronata TaxID=61149 RepID=A0A2P2JSQ9_RHIMU